MGRRKGNVAEREVAKLLEAWWRGHDPEARFERTPLSGGLQHAIEFDVVGDVMVRAVGFPWTIEVKRRETVRLDRLLAGKPTAIWGWWREAQDDAQAAGREPMLWFRRNRHPWWVMVGADFFRRVIRVCATWRADTRAFPPTPVGAGLEPVVHRADQFLVARPGWFAEPPVPPLTSG